MPVHSISKSSRNTTLAPTEVTSRGHRGSANSRRRGDGAQQVVVVKSSTAVHVHPGLRLSVSVRLTSTFGSSRTAPTWTAEDYASLWQSHHHEESYAVESIEGAIPADLEVRRAHTRA